MSYRGMTIIGWNYYNPNYFSDSGTLNNRIYVYPRIIKKASNIYEPILDAESDFPMQGRIEVRLTGGYLAEEIYDDFREIVEVHITNELEYNPEANNNYSARLNPRLGRDKSDIWVEKFSGKGFVQIISTNNWDITHNERRISYIGRVYTNEILVESNGKIYGPFDYDKKDDYIILTGRRENNYLVAEYNEDVLKKSIYEINNKPEGIDAINDDVKLILKSDVETLFDSEKKIDWIDDTKLIEYLGSVLKKQKTNTKDEIRRIKENLNELVAENSEMLLNGKRKERIVHLLSMQEEHDELVRSIVNVAMEDDTLTSEIVEYISKNHFDVIEKNSTELQEYKEKIGALQAEEEALNKGIEQAKNNLGELEEQARRNQGQALEVIKKQIEDAESEKQRLVEEVERKRKETDLLDDIEELQNQISELKEKAREAKAEKEVRENDLQETKRKQDDLDSELKEIIKHFNDGTTTVVSKLEKDFIAKVLREISSEDENNIISFDESLICPEKMTGQDIIELVQNILVNKAGRNVSYNDVVNYLTCIGQGFITTFAGLPGTGKTSLCTLIAKALGLARIDENKRYVEISVERGWTSIKDYIGYYNPLTKQLEKSNSEIFDVFYHMNMEKREENIAPMLVLLDEANLSPIEHYWASFIKNCDSDSTVERKLYLGGNISWDISEALRFVATVNFDHTTEELSPRFLDRSWVIVLEPGMVDDDSFENTDIDNSEYMVSYNDFKQEFVDINDELTIDESIMNKWKNIKNIFKECNMCIMPRNVKMVLDYCKIACKYMQKDTPETRYAPLDYAIAQKILPTLNGVGEDYNLLFDKLQEECGNDNMPLCSKIIDRMKKKASENMGYYQFFAM